MIFKVRNNLAGKTAREILLSLGIGKPRIYELFLNGAVLVNGNTVKENIVLKEDDTFQIVETENKTKYDNSIWENDYLVALYKPKNILTHTDGKEKGFLEIQKNHENLYVVQRLDNETSGIIVFSKSKYYAIYLDKLFRERLVTKEYLAEVKTFKEEKAIIKNALRYDRHDKKTRVYPESGPFITSVKKIKKANEVTTLKVILNSGMTHQIRAHLSYIGSPIIGDIKYGGKPSETLRLEATGVKFFDIVTNKEIEIKLKEEK